MPLRFGSEICGDLASAERRQWLITSCHALLDKRLWMQAGAHTTTVHGTPRQALQWLEAMGDHLAAAGLGSIGEILDGDPPHHPRRCIAQAWSVAEVLHAWTELSAMAEPAR